MIKIIPFFVFLLILSACSSWKYGGKSKVEGKEVQYRAVVIDQKADKSLIIDLATPESEDLAFKTEVSVQKPEENTNSKTLKIQTNPTLEQNNSWVPIQDKLVEVDDSIKKNDEIYAHAIKNEREGKKSMVLGILSILLSITPVFIVGFFLGLKGLRKSIRTLDERYITRKGLNAAQAGQILSIIGIVLCSIFIMALFAIILAFILFL